MENTIINYKEQNENIRLQIELSKQKERESKQRENELKMEKELILCKKDKLKEEFFPDVLTKDIDKMPSKPKMISDDLAIKF